jgi:TolB protein
MISRHFTTAALLVISGFLVAGTGDAAEQGQGGSIVHLTAVRDAYPYWSPDGTQIVFQSDRHDEKMGDRDIYVMNADGSSVTRLIHRDESDETPIWSPDGSQILFSSYITDENNELFIMNVDGTGITQLTDDPGRDGHQKFSPDGATIIFNSQRDDDGNSEITNYEIYEMNRDGTGVRRLTDFPEWDTYPSISPDGTKVLWRRVLPAGGNSRSGRNSEIFVMNRDGSGPVNLTGNPAFDGYPAWSPDGSKIVFASNRAGKIPGNFHIYIMNADGSDVVRVLDNDATAEDARPQWSPDGSRMLFNRQYVANESSIDILIVELPKELSVQPHRSSPDE